MNQMTIKLEVLEKQKVIFEKGKKCTDFDNECDDVSDHFACWKGDIYTGLADGYCPYVIGMK